MKVRGDKGIVSIPPCKSIRRRCRALPADSGLVAYINVPVCEMEYVPMFVTSSRTGTGTPVTA